MKPQPPLIAEEECDLRSLLAIPRDPEDASIAIDRALRIFATLDAERAAFQTRGLEACTAAWWNAQRARLSPGSPTWEEMGASLIGETARDDARERIRCLIAGEPVENLTIADDVALAEERS